MGIEANSLAERYTGLDPAFASLLDAARRDAPLLTSLDPAALRARVRSGDALGAPGPGLRDVHEIVIDTGLRARVYRPHHLRTSTVLVWFHGGGWVTGDLEYSDGFCRRLADTVGCLVGSIDYRLAPEHPFPAAVDDALTAARWFARGSVPVVLAGDSAGGNLAAVASQALSGDHEVQVAGQVLVYPVLDDDVSRPSYLRNIGLVLGAAEMTWFFDHYLMEEQRGSARFAPLRGTIRPGLAPAVIAVAGHDPLYDGGVRYAEMLQAADVPVTLLDFPTLVHGFLRFTGPVDAAADAAGQIAAATASLVVG